MLLPIFVLPLLCSCIPLLCSCPQEKLTGWVSNMGRHLLGHVNSNFNSLILYFAFLLDLQCIDSSRNSCPSGPSYEHEHCWWKLHRSQNFYFYFKLRCFDYCTWFFKINGNLYVSSITKKACHFNFISCLCNNNWDSIILESVSFSCNLIIILCAYLLWKVLCARSNFIL